MDQFLTKKLSEEKINEEIIVPVLVAFEDWLNGKADPEISFAVYVRLYDPSKTKELNQRHLGPNVF